jgi:uncharacterized protein DUF5752
MTTAQQPFQFVTASYLTRVETHKAAMIGELRDCLEHASDDAVFYHTFKVWDATTS